MIKDKDKIEAVKSVVEKEKSPRDENDLMEVRIETVMEWITSEYNNVLHKEGDMETENDNSENEDPDMKVEAEVENNDFIKVGMESLMKGVPSNYQHSPSNYLLL